MRQDFYLLSKFEYAINIFELSYSTFQAFIIALIKLSKSEHRIMKQNRFVISVLINIYNIIVIN